LGVNFRKADLGLIIRVHGVNGLMLIRHFASLTEVVGAMFSHDSDNGFGLVVLSMAVGSEILLGTRSIF
jgi:hypothetical protein